MMMRRLLALSCACLLAILVACTPETSPASQGSLADTPGPTTLAEAPSIDTVPAGFDAAAVGEGCGADTEDESTPIGGADCESPLSPTAASSPTLAPIPTAVPDGAARARLMGDAVLLFQRNEALTGFTKEWRLHPDGRLVGSDGSARQVSEEDVAQTLDEIEALGFFEMASQYAQGESCCPKYSYFLAIRDGDRIHQVNVTLTGPAEAPSDMMQILELVDAFVTDSA